MSERSDVGQNPRVGFAGHALKGHAPAVQPTSFRSKQELRAIASRVRKQQSRPRGMQVRTRSGEGRILSEDGQRQGPVVASMKVVRVRQSIVIN